MLTMKELVRNLLKTLIPSNYKWYIFQWQGIWYKLYKSGKIHKASWAEVLKYPRGTN